jgi:hypothetical protein
MSKVYTNNKKEAPFMGASFMHEIRYSFEWRN